MSSAAKIPYRNPVYPHYMADPFVLRVDDEYWAYGTGPAGADGRQFPMLHSTDLVHWRPAGHALEPLRDPPALAYWAPEVAQMDGRFYFFYSASTSSSDEDHRIRVATADRPDGPFRDSGKVLLQDAGFSIDPHPFRDPKSGKWFLYFATDYTADAPHGTGLAVAPLADDLMSVAGQPRNVLRASCDWQVYERQRNYKGQIWEAWHCIEGPFVVYRPEEDCYYLLFSGGAWHTESYGLGFATATDPLGPWKEHASPAGPPVLRGKPQAVLGPGHASVTVAPDGRTDVLVYHAWDAKRSARRMCIDPLEWTSLGPRCLGPSTETAYLPGREG